MVLKLQHYSLPCSLYKIKVEERLEDLLQNYVRMNQIAFLLEGSLCHIQNTIYLWQTDAVWNSKTLLLIQEWLLTTLTLYVICCSSAGPRFLHHRNYCKNIYKIAHKMSECFISSAHLVIVCYSAVHKENACCFLSWEHLQDLLSPLSPAVKCPTDLSCKILTCAY